MRNRFRRGSGTYHCHNCKRLTRDVDSNTSAMMCLSSTKTQWQTTAKRPSCCNDGNPFSMQPKQKVGSETCGGENHNATSNKHTR